MAKVVPSFANFDKGITQVTQQKDFAKLKLPDISTFLPSDSKVESKLPKMFKAQSLHNVMQEALMPTVMDKANLNPTVYQKRLQEAKEHLIKKLKEEKGKKKEKRRQIGESEDDDEEALFGEVIEDMLELEAHQDLLWMLRQVVHLA